LGQGEVRKFFRTEGNFFFAGALTKSLYPNALNRHFCSFAAAKALTLQILAAASKLRGAVPLTKLLLFNVILLARLNSA